MPQITGMACLMDGIFIHALVRAAGTAAADAVINGRDQNLEAQAEKGEFVEAAE